MTVSISRSRCRLIFGLSLFLLGVVQQVQSKIVSSWPASTVERYRGHYPGNLCSITNALLNSTDGTFHYNSHIDLHSEKCSLTSQVWIMQHHADLDDVECRQVYDVGYVYTIYFYHGRSNYFHLHWDMLLPLYQDVYYQKTEESNDHHRRKLAFMPSVESQRLQKINWDTPAFDDFNDYWVKLSKFLSEDHSFLPLTRYLLNQGGHICFKEVRFGTAKFDYSQPNLVRGFVGYVKKRFDIQQSSLDTDRIGIISRSNRRRILNEWELVNAGKELADTQLVIFDRLTFQQQVEAMQKFTVLVGMNGAGLMNCIYLPENGVCIQLVPHNCVKRLNYKEYG